MHPLKVYLDQHGISVERFRREVGASRRTTVYRWLRGERIPAPGYMARIIDLTDGAVTANDFYTARQDAA